MAVPPVYVKVSPPEPIKFNLLDTINPISGVEKSGFGVTYEQEACGVAHPFTSVCQPAADLGSVEVEVDDSSVATLTSTGFPDGTYQILWGDGDETPSEAEQINETHDYTAAGDGDYVIQIYKNGGGSYTEVTITVEDGTPSVEPFTAEAIETKVWDDGIPEVTGEPITVYHLFQCRLPGVPNVESEARRRALDSLDRAASRGLEEGFQTVFGTAAVDVTPSGTAVNIRKGLGLLEQYAAENYGGRAVIHMTREHVTLLGRSIVQVGDHLETRLGSLVIAGGGYDSSAALPSAPAAGAGWMYATGEVNIWQSDAKTGGIVLQDPYNNEYQTLAERTYTPTFECFKAAVEVVEDPA